MPNVPTCSIRSASLRPITVDSHVVKNSGKIDLQCHCMPASGTQCSLDRVIEDLGQSADCDEVFFETVTSASSF